MQRKSISNWTLLKFNLNIVNQLLLCPKLNSYREQTLLMKMDYLCQQEVLHPKLLMQPITISSLMLTNPNDQNFIRKLLPDGVASVSDILLALRK
jgi:hypothetical protein